MEAPVYKCGFVPTFLYRTYDSPLSTFEVEVIPKVDSFKEEGLVTPEG